MSIQAHFYKFSKKPNSTAQPSSPDRTYDINLKGAVSIVAPTIVVKMGAKSFNYVYIPDFERYYFVSNCTILKNELIQLELVVDVLATWKTSILSQSTYVLRSASNYNLKLVDDTWVHTSDFTEYTNNGTVPGMNTSGCYIIHVVNSDDNATINPSAKCYAMTVTSLRNLMAEMFDYTSGTLSDIYSDIETGALSYFNPLQYITACMWVPFPIETVAGSGAIVDKFKFGWWESDASAAYCISEYGHRITWQVPLFVNSYTQWTDRDPNWTRFALYIPGCGITEIDPCYYGQTVTINYDIDWNTGMVFCMAYTGTNEIAFQLSGQIGADVQINQVSLSAPQVDAKNLALGAAVGIAQSADEASQSVVNFTTAGAMSTAEAYARQAGMFNEANILAQEVQTKTVEAINNGKEVASTVAKSVLNAVLNPTVTSSGADGARFTITQNNNWILYCKYYNRYVDAHTITGGMCHQVVQLSSLSGYTVCANGNLSIPATMEEHNAIVHYLEGGFFIE